MKTKRVPMRIPKQVKFVEKLNVICYFSCLDYLSQEVKRLAALKHLNLGIRSDFSYKAVNLGFSCLIEAIKKVARLESFSFRFDHWDWATDEYLNCLSESFRVHNSLKTITLEFSQCFKITDLGISYLCQSLEHLTLLQNFSLLFWSYHFITNEGLTPIKTLLTKLKNLQTVKLYFKYCPKISLHAVEDTIQGFETSKIIINYLFSWEIRVNNATQRLGRFILFYIDFCSKDIQTQFKDLEGILAKRIRLKGLNLEFEYGGLDASRLTQQICQTLKALPFLQNLSFKFLVYSGVDDETLKEISHSLKYLSCPKYLSIKFMAQTGFTHKGLQSLCKNMKKCDNLENLELGFAGCYQITDKELESLNRSLRKIVSLQNISFDLSGCPMIHGSRLENFVRSLEGLVILQEITLKLTVSEKLASIEQDNIVEILEDHGSLRRVSLDFGQGLQTFVRASGRVHKKQRSGVFSLLGADIMSWFKKAKGNRKKR